MNEDFTDFLHALVRAEARFLVVGAHALAVHGVPRATGDLDVWIDRTEANARSTWEALEAFGAPVDSLDMSRDDLLAPERVFQLGVRPRRIDLLTDLTGVAFADAWAARIEVPIEEVPVPFIDRASLITNKRATGRLRDLADIEALGERPE